jgi:hypothetical protein
MAPVQIIDAQYRRTAIGLGLLRDRTNIDEEDLAAAMRKIQLRSGADPSSGSCLRFLQVSGNSQISLQV